ncbi:3D-(3,5/4)-trihydroxycyclohexane-1,2-dione acylhydrolase (decyclizing) [Catenulispora pinisilvae]|uniref:3D-(3,5/4)-trihydroxycyclohexane-1,2-dione acylhydrolase (decyclizing) n=1 Tax=Catenulispora pinisilvae TaxID=2705253 RepID=UPI001891459C|nr:3D-(3,5/4)-trihydroxycyclohexane-1,2-dione acylhydrolase (decyclizing) [Catenulispora pinisilvae]
MSTLTSPGTRRLTVAQALVRFLAVQHTERDGVEHRLIEGVFGIFGHGNVAGLGEALLGLELADPTLLPYRQARNEQAMVHTAAAFARMRDRLSTYACTTSVGPGATNLVTGAALATVNRLPVLLLPGDVFATRTANPVLQELEDPRSMDISVNDTLRPVSRYFDRVNRPEQLPAALLAAMRVLTDPADTGAVTLALPQDVQAEAWDWPEELFAHRVWHVPRPRADREALRRALAAITSAERPLIVAGGGVTYSQATDPLRQFAHATGVPVAETQAGKGAMPHDDPLSLGAVGATGTSAANLIAARADLVIGIGTRWSDFTTASRTVFADPGVRFVNINVAAFDAAKHAGISVVADARAALEELSAELEGWTTSTAYRAEIADARAQWEQKLAAACHFANAPLPSQIEVIAAVNDAVDPADVVVCAAGSMPGDLHKLWRCKGDPKSYHVEYGYSCMGYEIAGGLGVKLAAPEREVYVMVGDGSYLMLAQEIVTAVAEGVKLIVVLVDNGGYASIGRLSESLGSQRFGTAYRYRAASGRLDGGALPVDLAANAASLGAAVERATDLEEFEAALARAKKADRITVVHVTTDPLAGAPDGGAWWDVPVAQVSELESTIAARSGYEEAKKAQRPYL